MGSRNDEEMETTSEAAIWNEHGNAVVLKPDRISLSAVCDAAEQAIDNFSRRPIGNLLDHLRRHRASARRFLAVVSVV